MTVRRLVLRILALYILAAVFASACFAQIKLTTTLLPSHAESVPARAGGLLKISADAQNQSTSIVRLSFWTNAIPQQATITRVTLRLVGKPATPAGESNPQLVKLFVGEPGEDPIGQLTALPGESVFSLTSERLRGVIKFAPLGLALTSRSRLTDWDYYGLSDTDFASSFKPRLIVEYEVKEPDEFPHTTRTHRPFHPDLTQLVAKRFHPELTFISNPVFYAYYLSAFAKSSDKTFLYHFAWQPSPEPGNYMDFLERWHQAISVTPGSYALVTNNGQALAWNNRPFTVRQGLYSVGEDRIVLYDMEKNGAAAKTVNVNDLKLSVPPTVGADGSLFFVRSGYAYGLNPDLQELWRYPAQEGAGAETASRITLSPEGERYAYILTRRGKKNTLVRIDTTDGSATTIALSDKWTDFRRPLVVKGPEQDYVVASAYSQSDGTLSVYSGGALRWEQQGPVSQPIIDPAGKRVFVVQGGHFKIYDLLNGNAACTSDGSDLEATSNPVLDGNDNFYVWNNGTFFIYGNNCKVRLPPQRLTELPKDLELLFAPDGTLFARTAAQEFYTIRQSRPN
jgi:hypothetical protein